MSSNELKEASSRTILSILSSFFLRDPKCFAVHRQCHRHRTVTSSLLLCLALTGSVSFYFFLTIHLNQNETNARSISSSSSGHLFGAHWPTLGATGPLFSLVSHWYHHHTLHRTTENNPILDSTHTHFEIYYIGINPSIGVHRNKYIAIGMEIERETDREEWTEWRNRQDRAGQVVMSWIREYFPLASAHLIA